MDIVVLNKYIDKILNINIKSNSEDAAESLKLYQTFCWTLNDAWKYNYNKFFEIDKSIGPEEWGDKLPSDGFFYHLLYGVLYASDLCNFDENNSNEESLKNIKNIEYLKINSLDAALKDIQKKVNNMQTINITKDQEWVDLSTQLTLDQSKIYTIRPNSISSNFWLHQSDTEPTLISENSVQVYGNNEINIKPVEKIWVRSESKSYILIYESFLGETTST